MLFVQTVVLRWHKDVRSARFAAQRSAVRFREITRAVPPENAALHHTVQIRQTEKGLLREQETLRAYGAEALRTDGSLPFGARIAVTQEEDGYAVLYRRDIREPFHRKMLLTDGAYGRILLNARGTYYETGAWYYEQIVCNFVSAPYGECRKKLFFRKEPDLRFEDLRALYYSG
ncbi:MAG: hypothetical protein K6E36_10025 [Oscillospiraceae bacterium]|nr:hypothetical protein [Oscillospiraceae bacterium]